MEKISWSAVNLKKSDLDGLYTWARDMIMWYWSADTLFWQLSVDHGVNVKDNQGELHACSMICNMHWITSVLHCVNWKLHFS